MSFQFTDDELRDWIRANGAPAAHPVRLFCICPTETNLPSFPLGGNVPNRTISRELGC